MNEDNGNQQPVLLNWRTILRPYAKGWIWNQFHTISELVQTDDMPSTLFHPFERTWPLRADVICTEDLTPPNTRASRYSKCREPLYFKASHHNKSWLTQCSVWVTGGSQELSQTPSVVRFLELTLLHRKDISQLPATALRQSLNILSSVMIFPENSSLKTLSLVGEWRAASQRKK